MSLPAADDVPAVWYTTREAAEYAHVHYNTIKRAIYNGTLRTARESQGRLIRIRREWIDEWLEGGGGK